MEPTENTQTTETNKEEESLGTKSTLESIGPCRFKIQAEVPPDKVAAELDRNYKELISTVQIPGFRRGHVPRQLIEKRYGKEIEGDVKEVLLGLSFEEVVKEKELKIIGKPKFGEVAFAKGEPMRYDVEVEVRPEFALENYSGLEVESGGEPPAMDEAAIEDQLEKLLKKRPELIVIDPSAAGPEDFLLGHYQLRLDGNRVHWKDEVRFQARTDRIEGFEVPDLPAKVAARGNASSFTVPVKVPADYSEEVLRGKDVELEFTIEEARKVQFPALDDEFAKGYGVASLAELRDRIRKELEVHRQDEIEKLQEERVLERVAGSVQFDLPQGLLEQQVGMSRLRLELALIQEGVAREEIDAELKKLDEKAAEDIRREMKSYFILEKIADQEKIFATEDEVSARVAILAHAYGRSMRKVMDELEENGRLETLRTEIRHSKVRRFLREKAKFTQGGPAGGEATGAAPEAKPAPEASAAGQEGGAPAAAEGPGTEAQKP